MSLDPHMEGMKNRVRKEREREEGEITESREIDYVLLSAFGIIGTVLSSQTRQFELTARGE